MKNILRFLREASAELEHVAWPTRQETKRYFAAVVGFMVFFGAIIYIAVSLFAAGLYEMKTQIHPAVPKNLPNSVLPNIPNFSDEAKVKTVSSEAKVRVSSGTSVR